MTESSTKSHSPYPTPPHSAGPRQSKFSDSSPPNRYSAASTQIPTSTSGTGSGRHRNNSLPSRQSPADNGPLDFVRRDTLLAHRSPHLRKKHQPGPDSIDKLDTVGAGYHHEGPYDATLLARNTSFTSSPVEALRGTNREALKATPDEKIQDSLRKHMPLDGTAVVPPGLPDRDGRVYSYEEGTDMMIENGGNYKRWPGLVRKTPLPLKPEGKLTSYTEISTRRPQRQRRAFLLGRESSQRAQENPQAQRFCSSEPRARSHRVTGLAADATVTF